MKCLCSDCKNNRVYIIGNGKYFCQHHHQLGSKYTKGEIEKMEIESKNPKKDK